MQGAIEAVQITTEADWRLRVEEILHATLNRPTFTACRRAPGNLNVDREKVSVEQMPLGIVETADGFAWKYGGGQGVGGSTGLISNWSLMRQVGADARRIVDSIRLEYFHNAIGLPRGSWRAPAHTANAFVIQSFIDEIAHETGQDPLALRLDLLGEARELEYSNHGGPVFNPGRLARLIKFVAERIAYGKELPHGRGIGLATHFTFGGYAAHAIDVSVDDGKLTIERIVAAIDCGLAVHPNAVDAQLQGGTIDGLSTALGLDITVKDGQVQQSNFHDYPLARIATFPSQFETHILPYDDVPTGVGEIGLPSAAPALTNAIFAVTGQRIRSLPIGGQLGAIDVVSAASRQA